MIKVGDKVVWTQSTKDFKAKVIRIITPGEQLHKILIEMGLKPKSYTINISKRGSRCLCIDDEGNWYSPLTSNVYKQKDIK